MSEEKQPQEAEIVPGPPSANAENQNISNMEAGIIDSEDEIEEFEPRFGSGAGIFSGISDFQEEHPIIFFGTITIIVFLIIFGIVSLFIGGNDSVDVVEKQEEAIEEQTTVAPEGSAVNAIKLGISYSKPEAYSDFIASNIKLIDGMLESEEAQKFLVNELLTIKKLEDALAIDIQEILKNASNKEDTYNDYLESIVELEQRATQNYGELMQTHEVFQNRYNETKAEKDTAYETLNNYLATGSEKQIAKAITEYSSALENEAKIQARDKLVVEVINASTNPIVMARARIGGLKANEELLKQGLEAVDIDNSGLDLIKAGELEKYYEVAPGLDLDLSKTGTTTSNNLPFGDVPMPKVKIIGFE